MFTKCKDVRRLDPEKGVNKLFENLVCKCHIQTFFQGVEGEHILTFFPAELLQGKSRTKNISKGVGGNATPKIFLKIEAA